MPKARILLADDNSGIIDHVSRLLNRTGKYDVVAAVTDGNAVLRLHAKLQPQVMVLDISLGKVSGIDLARQLRDSGCQSKIVFLTVHEDPDFLEAAMGAGGSAYVVKSRLNLDLVSGIDAVLAGKIFVSGSLLYQQDQGSRQSPDST
jgi:DNA-binding NarL/FixJ family response regulator